MSADQPYNHPENLGKLLQDVLDDLSDASDSEKLAARTVKIYRMYRTVIESAYRQTAPYMLAHTNSVYIMNKDDAKTLIVYVDESIYAADLNAQRELIKLLFLELFNEQLDAFDIYVSRSKYKNNHPFIDREEEPQKQPHSLTEEELEFVEKTVARVEDPYLRTRIKKAMIATLQYEDEEKTEK